MAIATCSLGCSNTGGTQISCGVTDVFVNQEIQLRFTSPVDPTSVSNNSFQITEVTTGKTPAGAFSISSLDPNILIYRPQLTFDSAGLPIFGLELDKTYFLKVPGTALDPLGPYIKSTTGAANSSRLQCTLIASRGVFDARPGRPRASMTIDRVTGYDPAGNPDEFQLNVTASEATDVYRFSPVRIVFDDVMNPATLANPVTGLSSTIEAFVDADGDTSNPADRVPLQGTFTLTVDQNALRTTVIFQPSGGFPSAGSTIGEERRIVIVLSAQIADLGGNTVINPGATNFTPERIQFEPLVVEEPFADPGREDPVRSGNPWGNGILGTGPGGGSGRLGDLIVLPGRVVELDTDSEDFSGITDPQMFNPQNVIDAPANLEITDGIFEFARLRIDAGGVLRFRGSNPARIYVRGECVIQGLIDVAGTSGTLHTSDQLPGGTGGTPGPNGGLGGDGGDRPDGSAFLTVGGQSNPGAGPSNVNDPATYVFVNGAAGGGIAFPSTIDPGKTFIAGGEGGLAWPQPTTANPALHFPANVNDVSGLQPEVYQECRNTVASAPGGGGAHALSGGLGDGVYAGIPVGPIFTAPDSDGGDADDLGIDDTVRSLDPHLGLLRGGAGGGGGGAHLQRTQTNGQQLVNCAIPPPSLTLRVAEYASHSGAGGGAGGGALQIAAGRRLIHNGVIDASGGDGGSGTFPPDPSTPNDLAQAGGGGAGGGVLLQSQEVQIQAVPRRIDISGGVGGEGTGSPFPVEPSTGGRGAPGFLRVEASEAPEVANEESKIVPLEEDLQEAYGSGVSIEDIFTTAVWSPSTEVPSGMSGAQSCWIRPTGNFFRLDFEADGAEPGWDLRLRITGQANPQSFRGENDLFPGQTLESLWGNAIGGAPIVVRFQGARATGTLLDPCSVIETGATSPLKAGSLTSWVEHPGELSDFHGEESLTPNVFRFLVIWDKSQPEFAGIEGLEDLTVRIQPD